MELDAGTANASVAQAFGSMRAVVDRLGDALVNTRPPGPATNTAAALVVHCCGVAEYWLGHVVLGRPSDRDRAAEFMATATVAELHDRVAAAQVQAGADLTAIAAGHGRAGHPARDVLPAGPSDASVVLHVVEELYQHLGHIELTADALVPDPPA